MKLLAFFIPVIAVYAVDCLGFPGGSDDDRDSAAEPQLLKTPPIISEFQEPHLQDSDDEMLLDDWESVEDRGACSSPSISCTLAGGRCIKGRQSCEGTKDPKGCKGKTCKCCIPDKITVTYPTCPDCPVVTDEPCPTTDKTTVLPVTYPACPDCPVVTDEPCPTTDFNLRKVNFTHILGEAGATSLTHSCNCTASDTFDGTRFWHSGKPTMPQAIWFHAEQPIKVVMYSFKSRTANAGSIFKSDGPSKYEFFGSNGPDCSNQSSWEVLKIDNSGTPFSPKYASRMELVPHPGFYTCYGFKVIDVPGRSNGDKWVVMDGINWIMSRQ